MKRAQHRKLDQSFVPVVRRGYRSVSLGEDAEETAMKAPVTVCDPRDGESRGGTPMPWSPPLKASVEVLALLGKEAKFAYSLPATGCGEAATVVVFTSEPAAMWVDIEA